MDNKEFMTAIRKCVNDQCDDKCFMYAEDNNCQYKLLDIILYRMGVLPEDYKEWLEQQIKECR